MRMFFGWGRWRQMPNYYAHLSPEILREHVLADARLRQTDPVLKPVPSMGDVVPRFLAPLTELVQPAGNGPIAFMEERGKELERENRPPTVWGRKTVFQGRSRGRATRG